MTEDRNTLKNYWRRLEINRVKERRVICGYVEFKYPEIYKEAFEFYEFLNVKHPGKKDLRKTNEYEMLKSGVPTQTVKKYYKRKENKRKGNKKDMDLELIIPLLKLPTLTQENESSSDVSTQQIEFSSEIPTQEIPIQEIEFSSEIPTQEIEISSEIPTQEIPIQEIEVSSDVSTQENEFSSEVSTQEIEPLGHIRDEMIEEIMTSLREDPDLHALFDDIDIDIEEQSPLETELMYW